METLFPYHVSGGLLPLPQFLRFVGRNAFIAFVTAFAITAGVLLAGKVFG